MKRTIKTYFKFFIFLFGISLLLVNCEKDTIEETNEIVKKEETQESNFRIKTIKTAEIQQNEVVFGKLKKLGATLIKEKENIQGKDVYSSAYDFTINTDFARYIETTDGTYHSYTFPIERIEDNGLLENLFLSLQNDGTYRALIVTYKLTELEKEDLLVGIFPEEFENDVTYTEIDDEDLLTDIFSVYEVSCADITIQYCTSEANHPGGEFADGSPCNAVAYSIRRICSGGSDGSGYNPDEGTGGDDGAGNDAGGGTSTTTDTTDPTDTITGDVDLPVITTPTIIPDSVSPCETLNNLIDPTKANIKPDLEHLKTLVEESQENGVSFKKSGETYNSINISPGLSLHITLPISGDVYSGAHTHTDDAYPMFDWGDLFGLFHMYDQANINVKDEVTLFLVSQDYLSPTTDVYAVVINDIDAFALKIQQDINSLRVTDPIAFLSTDDRVKVKVLNEKYGIGFDNSDNYERIFLESFKNHNISLYKANEDISNWSKLTIPESVVDMSVNKVPCVN